MPQGDNGTDLTNLQQARTNYIQQLRDMARQPSVDYSLDGQSVSKSAYQRFLIEQIDTLNHLIAYEGGPIEQITVAILNGGAGGMPYGSVDGAFG